MQGIGMPRPGILPIPGKFNMVRLTTTQVWVAPDGVDEAIIIAQQGGQGGSSNVGGDGSPSAAGQGGDTGISFVKLRPGSRYTATVGAGTVGGGSPALGAASSFVGENVNMSSASADIIIGGSQSPAQGGTPSDSPPSGGATLLGGFGRASLGNNGVGGDGGRNNGGGPTNGANGVVLIFY